MRLIANASIAVGFFLFARVIYGAVNGSLVAQLFPESQKSAWDTVVAVALSLPVPFHVIAVGLILQRRWLPRSWTRISLPATIISGCWLAAALGIKWFVFR